MNKTVKYELDLGKLPPLTGAQGAELKVTLPPKNVPLAECFNPSKENGNDEDSAGALHAGIQAGSDQVGRGWTEHRGGRLIAGGGGADAVQLGQGAAPGQAQRR